MTNIGDPLETRDKCQNRALKLRLTDGRQRVDAFEHRRCPELPNPPPPPGEGKRNPPTFMKVEWSRVE